MIAKSLRSLAIGCLAAAPLFVCGLASGATGYGKMAGVVFDPAGTPQMGASVWVAAESGDSKGPAKLLSDQNGTFTAARLQPGLYSVRATLSGFLPALEQHVRIAPDATTLVRIEMSSVFTSLGQLRQTPAQPSDSDDWMWVLRSSAATRPVLQYRGGVLVASASGLNAQRPRGRVEMTSGARDPGSSSALPGPPTTAASYDQALGPAGRLLVSAGMIYNDGTGVGPGVSFASIWLPTSQFGTGPETTFVMRDLAIGPEGKRLRNMRIEHSEHVSLGDHAALEYGAEYLMAGVDKMSSSVRPRARVGLQLTPHWAAALAVETEPGSYRLRSRDAALESAVDALDTLPVLIWKDGNSAIEGSWHEELSLRRTLGPHASIEAAGFHDRTGHQAVFGYGSASAGSDFPEAAAFAGPYAHDAGTEESWGARAVYRQSIFDNLEVAAIYAYGGALAVSAPGSVVESDLHDALRMQYRQSVAGRVAAKVPGSHTTVAASYKWVEGAVVSRQDVYGEALLGIDPNLSLVIRQPLPSMHTGHLEAIADFRNLMAQGYVHVSGEGGQIVLVPVVRSFRGGLSFQF